MLFCKCGTIISVTGMSDYPIKCIRCNSVVNIQSSIAVTEEKSYLDENNNEDKSELVHNKKAVEIINEVCPNCNNSELSYTTLQLRSADEGQTVFYKCLKCNHKFTLNS